MAFTKRIEERSQFTAGKVDRTGSYPVVREVLLCGTTSANRRRYRKEAFAGDRVKKYTNRPVFLDHGSAREARKYADKIATIENPRTRADGLPVGDLAVNPNHPLAEAFLWDAEHKPQSCGMSHVAHCETVTSADGWEEITEVVSVESVDIVTDPATTRGLHTEGKRVPTTIKEYAESFARNPKAKVEQILTLKRLAEMDDMGGLSMDAPPEDAAPEDGVKDAFSSACMHIIGQALDGELDPKEALGKLKKLIASHGEVNGDGKPTDPPADPPADDDKKPESRKRPDSWVVLSECRDAEYSPTPTELELLAEIADPAKRQAFVKEQKQKAANARAEKPQSTGRTPGAGVKVESKPLPKSLAELRAFVAQN